MIHLRNAKAAEITIINNLAEQIWPQTYSAYISKEQLRFMLDKMYNAEELLTQLQDGHTFIIASENGKDVGFAGFSLIDEQSSTYKLHKLYVLPELHGKGVGKILMNEVVNLAVANGGKSLQLNVNRNNKAKDFYIMAGFKIKETVDLDIGNGFFMNDYVMERSLIG
ncbi:GNAT family N-acetyltransferase [Pedobacter insulae]|uniref:Acetyltransferase (GNAT) domain-containing protein n=1 Tax=Pedobacter insulae TaxID=414048 RepID=A0A1I2X5F4_9SPHI|nr:GNAT family N-acetyltransferase [Pedobacter insulae]SFH08773.1 Acetyltransferase (GNAT) domain-containing protein [Pedobacter insulae]